VLVDLFPHPPFKYNLQFCTNITWRGGGEVAVQLCKEYLFNWKNMLNVKEIKK